MTRTVVDVTPARKLTPSVATRAAVISDVESESTLLPSASKISTWIGSLKPSPAMASAGSVPSMISSDTGNPASNSISWVALVKAPDL